MMVDVYGFFWVNDEGIQMKNVYRLRKKKREEDEK